MDKKLHALTIDLSGKKFGKLTVIKFARNDSYKLLWLCLCDCGKEKEIIGECLRRGSTISCGCYKKGRKPLNYNNNREFILWRNLYLSTVMKRAKKKKYISDITLDDFIRLSKMPCHYCGRVDVQTAKDYNHSSRSLVTDTIIKFNGIDRIDSNKGYLIDNVVSCCKHCNTAKNIFTQDEFKVFIESIYNNYCKPINR